MNSSRGKEKTKKSHALLKHKTITDKRYLKKNKNHNFNQGSKNWKWENNCKNNYCVFKSPNINWIVRWEIN